MGNVSKTSPVNGLQWVEHLSPLKEDFIRNCDDNNDVGYFLEIDIEYPKKKKSNLHKDLLFLPERKKVKKCNKLVCNIQDKENYVIHIKALKKALNHGLKLKKVHRVIKFDQNTQLKQYIDMNTKLRKRG